MNYSETKILFILHLPPPVHGASMVGQYIHDSKVVNQSFDCHYLNLTLAKDLNDIGRGGPKKLIAFVRQLYKIRKEILRIKPALCYVTPNTKGGAFYKDFCVVMLLQAMGQKVIAHYHNKGVSTRQKRLLDNLLYKLFFKNQQVILLAEPLYQDIKKYVPRKKISICPNGMPASKGLKPFKRKNKVFQILFLSNMMAEKGVWDLLDACSILKHKGRNFQCHFVGKWSDITQEAFEQRVKASKLEEQVCAHGAAYGEAKNVFIQDSDLFVFPTYYPNECFPLVLLEAMEQSLPCISTTEGGVSAIIENGVTGFIVDRHSPQQLAEKIAYLIARPDLCTSMGEAGKEKFLQEFTLEIFENRMKKILETCLH